MHGDDALVKALDKDIASLQGVASLADGAALGAYAKKERSGARNYWKAVSEAFRVPFGKAWYGEVGYADSTLASDGQRIYGVFNQGQAFCLDLDGKMLWGFQDQAPDRDNRVTFHRSPLLCEGLLLFSDYKSSPVVGGSAPTTMRAFDSKTGRLRWASHMPGCNYPIPRVVNLARPDGTAEPEHHHPDHAAPAEKHNFAFPLSARIRTWVKFYNWHNIGHLTHPLVFQQKFSEEISALVLDMEMNGQKMRGELIMKHYENALGLCGKIDTLCRQGCKNEDDVRTLEQLCRIIQRPINGLADLIDGYCRLDIEAEQSKLEQTRLTTRTQRTPPLRTGSAAPAMPYDQAGVGGSSNLDSESLRQVELGSGTVS